MKLFKSFVSRMLLYVRILCLSWYIKRSKTTAKLSENSWYKRRSKRFQRRHLWRQPWYCYRFFLLLNRNQVPETWNCLKVLFLLFYASESVLRFDWSSVIDIRTIYNVVVFILKTRVNIRLTFLFLLFLKFTGTLDISLLLLCA
jgi:hypothetical protein